MSDGGGSILGINQLPAVAGGPVAPPLSGVCLGVSECIEVTLCYLLLSVGSDWALLAYHLAT